ncbi:putative Histidine kinase [Rubrivivax sp. A210]|uniref:PAS domain S-box protein n=1 Tax=Rubrivivax sp. A210 TaxID=2772301 RepID=UPI0019183AD1|nr:PAS domain S-box protein [Rubrivivax sp. A210]CAD5373090.1 putative Histidine kinase [Rubrivivax sp. A210]
MSHEPPVDLQAPAGALLAGDKLFRRLIELANDVAYVMDLQGRLEYVSPKWRDIFGTDPGELIGKDYAPLIHPDDLARCVAAIERTALLREQQCNIEYRIRHGDGPWHHQSSNIAPLLDDDGQLIGVLGIGRDITAQVQAEERLRISEERYRLLADYASDVVWTMELDGSISYLSPSIERARGLTVEEAKAQPLHEALAPESVALVADYFRKLHHAIQNRLPVESFRGDMQYFHKDGSPYWGEVLATPALDRHGHFKQIVGVTRDINERRRQASELERAHDDLAAANQLLKAANAELDRHRRSLEALVGERTLSLATARQEAESANAVKTRLIMNASHEMRTPLQGILGYAEIGKLGARDVPLEELESYFDTILSSGRQMHRLVEDLLTLADNARAEHAESKGAGAQDIDVEHFAHAIGAMMGLRAEKWGQHLAVDIQTHSLYLLGDPARLTQVFEHLLGNAFRYSRRGATTLWRVRETTCRREKSAESLPAVSFEIIDQGCGIPESELKVVFEPFHDSSRTRNGAGGTGLGLPLSQGIVARHGGTITLENRPESGLTCRVVLPARAKP